MPAGRIDEAWMRISSARAVVAALEAQGGPGCARFVGGCVRNALMGRAVDDVDIATTLTPDEVTAALRAAGLKAVPTGVEHGTVTGVAEHQPYEITTLRRDVETDGRRAVVAFTKDWGEDAQRRDFRLNAIYADPDGTLFDPTGEGVADAHAGRIVFVGDAATRVREDYLRILRFFRFQAWYGRADPDAHALATCAALKTGLRTLSVERIAKELLKLLAAANPMPALQLMQEAGVLAEVLPEADGLDRLRKLVGSCVPGADDPLLRLAALTPADPDLLTGMARRLRLSNAYRDRLAGAAGRLSPTLSDHEARRAVYGLGRRAVLDRLMLGWAEASSTDLETLDERLAFVGRTETPPCPVTGAQIVATGVQPGPLVGQVQKAMEAWWIAHDFAALKTEIREALTAEVNRALTQAA